MRPLGFVESCLVIDSRCTNALMFTRPTEEIGFTESLVPHVNMDVDCAVKRVNVVMTAFVMFAMIQKGITSAVCSQTA